MEVVWFFGVIFALIFGLTAFFAQIRLFNISKIIGEIRDELLILRQERQASKTPSQNAPPQ